MRKQTGELRTLLRGAEVGKASVSLTGSTWFLGKPAFRARGERARSVDSDVPGRLNHLVVTAVELIEVGVSGG